MQRVITGFHSIEEILRSRTKNELKGAMLLYSSCGPRAKKIIEMAMSLGVPIQMVDKKDIEKRVAHLPQFLQDCKGIILIIEENSAFGKSAGILKGETLNAFLAREKDAERLVVFLLDGISDCHNMGSIIRSAEQFGIDAVIVPRQMSAGGEEGILKSSAGAAAWMNVIEVPNLNHAITMLKDSGFWVYVADMGGEPLGNVSFAERVAIVMGSEGSGVSRLVKKNADAIISIEMSGKIDSLNVSVAAGIIMYEIVRIEDEKK